MKKAVPFSIAMASEMYASGESLKKVARRLGVCQSRLRQALVDSGIEIRDKGSANRGRRLSQETRQRMSEGKKRLLSDKSTRDRLFAGENNPFFGKTHKPETIAAQIAKQKALRPAMSTTEKFERRVFVNFDGCWLWLGPRNGAGYGTFKPNKHGETYLAHRFAWCYYYEEIPPKKCVLHRCDVKICVNPKHLFIGSHKDNTADMITKGRAGWQQS